MTPVNHYLWLLLQPFLQMAGCIFLSVVPGWFVVRKWKIDPLTRLVVGVIISYVLIYLLEFGAYVLSIPQWIPFSVLLLASAAAFLFLLLRRDTDFPWNGIAIWIALSIWITGLQSQIVVYGGTGWFGDWYEHYERAIFFLDQLPINTRFLYGFWSLPARAPMFNTTCGYLIGVVGQDFSSFQVVATVLNAFAVLPMALLLRDSAGLRENSAFGLSLLLLAISPLAVQQETFTWSKFFTLAITLAAIHLYVTGIAYNERYRVAGSMLVFAAGILAHYLVILFVIFFAGHYLYYCISRKWNWRTIVYPAVISALLVGTWLVFVIGHFGWKETFTANSTFGVYNRLRAEQEAKAPASWSFNFAGNLISTFIPARWRHDWSGSGSDPQMSYSPNLQKLNDFATDAQSLTGALGIAGLLGLFFAVFRKRFERSETSVGTGFWLIFFMVGIPLNVLASRDYVPKGVVHLNLQPFVILIVVWIAGRVKDSRVVTIGLMSIFLIESGLRTGALLTLEQQKVPIIIGADGKPFATATLITNPIYVSNYIYKLRENAQFLSDQFAELKIPFLFLCVALSIALGITVLRRTNAFKPAPELPTE